MKKTFKTLALLTLGVVMLMTACDRDNGTDNPSGGTTPMPLDKTLTFMVDGVNFKMVLVEAGTFTMGANEGDTEAYDKELPRHEVSLTQDYYIAETEVTQELYTAVMGSNPSYFTEGSNLPVERVSHNDAQLFCISLSSLTGRNFTLPTEAQWEYAARGGHKAPASTTLYAGSNDVDAVAWHDDISGKKTHPVAFKASNALGLYDMSGNVWEWCLDWYSDYGNGAETNPQGPASGSSRVSRGGSCFNVAKSCRVSHRNSDNPTHSDKNLGFRIVMLP